MKLQRLLSLVRQAVDDYALIDDQDHIAVGVSGGKDSLVFSMRSMNCSAFTRNILRFMHSQSISDSEFRISAA